MKTFFIRNLPFPDNACEQNAGPHTRSAPAKDPAENAVFSRHPGGDKKTDLLSFFPDAVAGVFSLNQRSLNTFFPQAATIFCEAGREGTRRVPAVRAERNGRNPKSRNRSSGRLQP
jgi:hypothetical protein